MTAPEEHRLIAPDEERPAASGEDHLAASDGDGLAASDGDRPVASGEGRPAASGESLLTTPPDESRLDETQHLIDEAKKIAHDLREEVPDTAGAPPREEGSPAN
ncbi:hypothetical protein [Lentzea californiensis]|uniref:hypothetical protein n=1 Tax=Lentzea californiensis TaxID=438851 RepID=UPI002164DB2F|nr:hypothetical protein [Lentzea californiensis]MCR3747186.1 hypothetical protein [Lentzea californiensis]